MLKNIVDKAIRGKDAHMAEKVTENLNKIYSKRTVEKPSDIYLEATRKLTKDDLW
jgi:hypothetical protein